MSADAPPTCVGSTDFQLYADSRIVIQGDDNLPPRIVDYLNDTMSHVIKASLCCEKRLIEIDSADTTLALKSLYNKRTLFRYTHRYFVVQETTKELTWEAIQSLAYKHNIDLSSSSLRLNLYPKAALDEVLKVIPETQNLSPTQATQILALVRYIDPSTKEVFWKIGFSPIASALDHQAAFVMLEDENNISRAFYKIQEAVDRCGVEEWPQPTWNAVDIGASPGGWSLYLSEVVGTVYAVDPADLIVNRPNIVHLKGQLLNVLPQIESIPLHVIVCDMNADPEIAIDCIKALEPRLQIGGRIILTFKYQKRAAANIERRLAADSERFCKALPTCDVLKTMHMVSNHHERTLVGVKSRASTEAPAAAPSASE